MTEIYRLNFSDILKKIEKIETDTLLLVIDKKIDELYVGPCQSLKNIDRHKVITFIAQEGESTKNFSELEKALEFFLKEGIHRKAHLVTFGGGATSDFGGMVASLLLRGISWSAIPTTVLSMVDASIGGKVGINSTSGKNLVGGFHLPDNIFIDESFVDTLSIDEKHSGDGEIIKYIFLSDDIHYLTQGDFTPGELFKSCADYKLKITEEDFKESGKRKYLNLGHTIGHAIESEYKYPHGMAVFWGMFYELKLFGRDELVDELLEYGHAFSFPLKEPLEQIVNIDKLMEYILKDKKIVNQNEIELIDIPKIGNPLITKMSLKEFKTRFKRVLNV